MTKNDIQKTVKPLSLFIMGILMGVLFARQSASVDATQKTFERDSRAGFYKEIELLKRGNQALFDELNDLEKELMASSDIEITLQKMKQDINRFSIIAGTVPAQGEGIIIKIDGEIKALWLTDLVNELFSAGAEVISVNGNRLAKKHSGFDNIPNGKILMGGKTIETPFTIEAIGKGTTLFEALNQSEGIVLRMKKFLPNVTINTQIAPMLLIQPSESEK